MTVIEDVTIEGDDSQNAFGNMVSRDLIMNQLNFVRGRPSMVLSDGEIADRVAEYVPAVNHDEIVESLRRDRVVALAGPPGSGVATTAIAALRQLHPHVPIQLFSAGEDDVEEIGATEARGYLIRAGDEEESRLRACLEAVLLHQGFLLVVGTEAEHRPFTDFLHITRVQPPPAVAVYRRRLIRCDLGDTHWPGWPRATELLKDASPNDGRRLADLVLAVRRNGGDVLEVERAYQGWAEDLHAWFNDHPELRDQTLMVAAATITPADETSVYGAALSLARQLEIDAEGGGLAWRPSTGLKELLGADFHDGKIVFRRQGYASSVLRHVWENYPLARLDLLTWLSKLPTDDVVTLEPTLSIKIVEAFADLAAEHGSAEKIVQTAERWAGDEHWAADLAYTALARTCLHPLVGGRVRRRLYEWSRERHAAQTLKLTVVRVCEVLGQTHVSIALTRLKHLATYGNAQVQDEVFDVACELGERHPDVVFGAALEWCYSSSKIRDRDAINRLQVGVRLLLARVLADDPPNLSTAAEIIQPAVRSVMEVLEHLATRDNEQIHLLLLTAARMLAERHRAVVLGAALAWADNATIGRLNVAPAPKEELLVKKMGTELFLAMAVEKDSQGLAITLTGAAALDPRASLPAWRVALTAVSDPADEYGTQGGYEDFEDAVRLWLDTAVARPDLRQGIVTVLAAAADHEPTRRLEMVELVRSWAGTHAERRPIKEGILVRLLLPEWQRLLLMVFVWLRTMIGAN